MMLQTLKGYKVVYNIKGYDITAGNSQIFQNAILPKYINGIMYMDRY